MAISRCAVAFAQQLQMPYHQFLMEQWTVPWSERLAFRGGSFAAHALWSCSHARSPGLDSDCSVPSVGKRRDILSIRTGLRFHWNSRINREGC